jgi:hypothetical protein
MVSNVTSSSASFATRNLAITTIVSIFKEEGFVKEEVVCHYYYLPDDGIVVVVAIPAIEEATFAEGTVNEVL